jgi:hypothetical protein
VVGVHFDLWVLRLVLRFEDTKAPTYVDFEAVSGFRVLDEGDLLEFWAPEVRQPGWLWQVESGGWLALESTRSGFLRRDVAGMKEYLVTGVNDCVSVFAGAEPKIHEPAL